MKVMIFVLVLMLNFITLSAQNSTYINPTGTYKLAVGTEKVGKDVFGYFGDINIRKLSNQLIIMSFYVCVGAPSYNSGSFIDTLKYVSNNAIYKAEYDSDPSCEVTFRFNKNGISVKEKTDDYNFGCGFGHSVSADGFYKKTSSKEPDPKAFMFN